MNAGIYKLCSNDIPQVYIGQTTNLSRRKIEHLEMLSAGNHHNDELKVFSKIWEFHFVVIETPPSELNTSQIHDWLGEREFFYIENTPCLNKIPGERLTSYYEDKFKLTGEYIPYAQHRISSLKEKLDRLKNNFVPETKTETIKAKPEEKWTSEDYLMAFLGFCALLFFTYGWGILLTPVIAFLLIRKPKPEADTILTYTTSYRDDNEYNFVKNDLFDRELDLEICNPPNIEELEAKRIEQYPQFPNLKPADLVMPEVALDTPKDNQVHFNTFNEAQKYARERSGSTIVRNPSGSDFIVKNNKTS